MKFILWLPRAKQISFEHRKKITKSWDHQPGDPPNPLFQYDYNHRFNDFLLIAFLIKAQQIELLSLNAYISADKCGNIKVCVSDRILVLILQLLSVIDHISANISDNKSTNISANKSANISNH